MNIKLSENSHGASQKGLIKTIFTIVIALVVLGYFGFNVVDIFNNTTVQANLNAFWDFLYKIWINYLAVPFIFIFGILWKLFENGLNALGL